ncbi:MAG: hypothetical protein IIC01_05380 [Planctomycetes bacterium]|nr:hypothetical protein [Planctomycetota bacterium]
MEKMFNDYKDIAEFFVVYISEAHALDDRRPVGYAEELGIKEHQNYGERCIVADRLFKDKKLTMPCLIDGMDNAVEEQYHGFPDRVFLVRTDGVLAVAGRRGPRGFKPGLKAARTWLAQYKKTGQEPELVVNEAAAPDVGELHQSLFRAYRGAEYKKALSIGEKILELDPHDMGTMYNVACLHCLLGHKKHACVWLGKAIDAGYNDVNHMLSDDDLASIRDTERFRRLIERARSRASGSSGSAETTGSESSNRGK